MPWMGNETPVYEILSTIIGLTSKQSIHVHSPVLWSWVSLPVRWIRQGQKLVYGLTVWGRWAKLRTVLSIENCSGTLLRHLTGSWCHQMVSAFCLVSASFSPCRHYTLTLCSGVGREKFLMSGSTDGHLRSCERVIQMTPGKVQGRSECVREVHRPHGAQPPSG